MENIVLKIENVTKKYGKKTIIDKLSLNIESGQVYGFLGPNGAGKTTTIKMIVGLINIDGGRILINNIDIVKNHKKAMKNVGAIVESPDLYKYLSGLENIKLYSRMHNISKDRVNEIIKFLELEEVIKDKVKTYSLGMKQRLGLGVALLHKPRLLILDEPTNGLDPAGIKKLRDMLKKLAHKENVAVFISSHMLNEVQIMCDKAAIIDKGKLIRTYDINNSQEVNNVYILKVSNIEKSIEILKDICICKVYDNDIIIKYNEKISEVVKKLINNDIEVYSFNSKQNSLEDEFLKITGGVEEHG